MRYFTVKNFETFQHYKNKGSMAWIKLYAALLTDYEFAALPDESKAHLMLIWLLVSQRHDRRIPDDPKWVARHIGASGKVDLRILADNGWLICLEKNSAESLDKVSRPLLESALDRSRAVLQTGLEQNRGEEKRIDPSDLWGHEGNGNGTCPDPEIITPQELVESWNDICAPAGLSKVTELSAKRLVKVRERLKEHPKVEFWETVLNNIPRSRLLRGLVKGNGHDNWRVTFDWMVETAEHALRIFEGQYNNG